MNIASMLVGAAVMFAVMISPRTSAFSSRSERSVFTLSATPLSCALCVALVTAT